MTKIEAIRLTEEITEEIMKNFPWSYTGLVMSEAKIVEPILKKAIKNFTAIAVSRFFNIEGSAVNIRSPRGFKNKP